MLRRKAALGLMIGLLSVIGLSASDKDCPCAPKKKAQDCPCAPQVRRQKPYKPARSIAPRDLPLVYESQARLAAEAAEVLEDFPNKSWLENASAIAVIPSVKKGAFGFGFRWGGGLISMRDESGCWIPPSYIRIHGGNFGFQAGFQATDLVLIFTNSGAVKSLLRGKLTLNADASGAVLKWGRKGQVGVPLLVNSGIYTFSRSKGVFAGVSLDGAAITIADTNNHAVYGRYITGTDILMNRRVQPNNVVAPFLDALATYAPGRELATAQQDTTPPEAETVAGTQQ